MSPMIEDDAQLEQIEAQVIPTPLCDEEDESALDVVEAARDEGSAEDVEAHGGGGFNEQK